MQPRPGCGGKARRRHLPSRDGQYSRSSALDRIYLRIERLGRIVQCTTNSISATAPPAEHARIPGHATCGATARTPSSGAGLAPAAQVMPLRPCRPPARHAATPACCPASTHCHRTSRACCPMSNGPAATGIWVVQAVLLPYLQRLHCAAPTTLVSPCGSQLFTHLLCSSTSTSITRRGGSASRSLTTPASHTACRFWSREQLLLSLAGGCCWSPHN